MTKNGTIGVGIIGCGNIAGSHIRGYLLAADHAEVAAIADVDSERARSHAATLGEFEVFEDYRELIESPRVDAVDICLPHHLHRDAIVLAAENGKHILCEKPLCLTAQEARDVQSAVRAHGVTLMCAHNQLFMPAVAKAREILDAGLLGAVYEVRTTDSFYNDFDPSSMGWRASASTSGGGELIDTGYHPTYLLLHLAGGQPVEATAMLSKHRLAFMEGEDSAQVLVRFDSGVVGQIVTSWAYDPAPITERFSAVGERGALHSDPKGTSLTLTIRDEPSETYTFEPVNTYVAEIGHFADALIGGTRPLHTEVEGIAVLSILLAAYESAAAKTVAPIQVLVAD
jgi:predicted dehydrogenase